MNLKLENKVAIVTACTKGIGLQIALDLAKEGAKVYLAARNKESAQKIINEHKDLKLAYTFFDVSDRVSLETFVDEVYEKEQRVDILVNNFGTTDVMKDKSILDTKYDDYISIMDKNMSSLFIPIQSAAKIMKQQNFGSIVNVSSIGAITPDLARIAYATSKATVNSLTQNVACQLAKYNIRCNAVMPGMIDTDALRNNLPPQFLTTFLKSTPLNRIGATTDISNAVLFLASDMSAYITGECLSVAGGYNKFTPLFSSFNK